MWMIEHTGLGSWQHARGVAPASVARYYGTSGPVTGHLYMAQSRTPPSDQAYRHVAAVGESS
eukprot:121986-Hanusia_phi.AAC.1